MHPHTHTERFVSSLTHRGIKPLPPHTPTIYLSCYEALKRRLIFILHIPFPDCTLFTHLYIPFLYDTPRSGRTDNKWKWARCTRNRTLGIVYLSGRTDGRHGTVRYGFYLISPMALQACMAHCSMLSLFLILSCLSFLFFS